MKRYSLIIAVLFLFAFIAPVLAQPEDVPEDVWQEPWEGVPEHYQKWTYPDFAFPSSLSEWKKERIKVRDTLLELLGDLPPRPKPQNVRIEYHVTRDGYSFEKFWIDNGTDAWIPAYLALPANVKGKVPVILGMHGHSSRKENIIGNAPGSQSVMALLVSHGYAVMAIDSYFNGERRGKGPAGEREMQRGDVDQERSLFKLHLWFGRSLWGMQIRDEQIALDYLSSRPEIDADRIGVEGMSMGSTRAWWVAAVDERVKAVVGIACFTRYKELIEQRYLRAHGIYYFVPGMLQHFDTEAVMGLIAPRPFLALTGDSDRGSPLTGMKVLEKKLDEVYSLYGKKDNFKSIIYPNTGHTYTDDMKLHMLHWFDKFLK